VFTGLINDLGEVSAIDPRERGASLRVRTRLARELSSGDSVAVNGVCLTAAQVGADEFAAQVMGETLARSALGALRPGAAVNLELALRAQDRLGGHIVLGHVDGTGAVSEVRDDGFARVLWIDAGADLLRYMAHKGSVALDGVSLTVSDLAAHGFAVSLIPETLGRTNLGAAAVGTVVNIEVDILAKQLERLVGASTVQLSEAAPS
jgi:riboflavin synthase